MLFLVVLTCQIEYLHNLLVRCIAGRLYTVPNNQPCIVVGTEALYIVINPCRLLVTSETREPVDGKYSVLQVEFVPGNIGKEHAQKSELKARIAGFRGISSVYPGLGFQGLGLRLFFVWEKKGTWDETK